MERGAERRTNGGRRLNPLLSEAVFSMRGKGAKNGRQNLRLNPLLSEAVFSIIERLREIAQAPRTS